MNTLRILPGKSKGKVHVPTSKSQTHRAILCAAMARGLSTIENVILSDDILATIEAAEAFGAEIVKMDGKIKGKLFDLRVLASGRIVKTRKTIDCRESGSTLRFSLPLALTTGERFEFIGRGKLPSRPMEAYYKILREKGIMHETDNGNLPLTVKGKLKAGTYSLEGNVSSQYVTGLLLALPFADGPSEIVLNSPLESGKYVDITLQVQESFGVRIKRDGYKSFYVEKQDYRPANVVMEGDYSQAAFWMVAGLIGECVEIEGLKANSAQGDRAAVDLLLAMGGRLHKDGKVLKAEGSSMKSIRMDASDCPDLVPIMAVAAAVAEGTTRIVNAERLRHKESDRLKATSVELNKLGAKIMETEHGLIIEGVKALKGGTRVWSHNDHRIAMALTIASTVCQKPVIIEGMDAINKSYPDFIRDFKELGGKIHELDMG
ncbi:MAG: 3-phosphoshikimate 1-carboxyvinyltransferase [Peptostreptococcaceae bacterium]|nr:3-phosphoshikimate 1-carboxyvinyltransferase [Peptostreptococcaceae bacterium]